MDEIYQFLPRLTVKLGLEFQELPVTLFRYAYLLHGCAPNAPVAPEMFKSLSTILYEWVYKMVTELEKWEKRDDVNLWRCIDWKFGPQGILEEPQVEGWPPINLSEPSKTEVGLPPRKFTCFVPQMVEVANPPAENTIAVVCGPPIMIKFTFPVLDKLGFDKTNVYTTLENRMKCGFGKCGRCNVGEIYVCKEGPVFTADQLSKMPQEY